MTTEVRGAARPAALGGLALVLWLMHAVDLVFRGEAHDLLWICNLAGPVVGLGFILGSPRLTGVGTLWLSFGTPLWLLEMLTGGEVIISSFGSHFGVLALGIVAARRQGFPPFTWLLAVIGQVAVLGLSRVVTPARFNVNLAFRVWQGWEDTFPSYGVYFAVLLAGSALLYLVLEKALLARLSPR